MSGIRSGSGIGIRSTRVRRWTLLLTLAIALIMVSSTLGLTGGAVARVAGSTPAAAAISPAAQTAPSSAADTYPTTTQQEPNYTGGNYIMGSDVPIEHLNVYAYDDLYSGMLLDEIYDSLDAYAINQTYIPWAASSWTETAAPSGTTVFDPLTASMQSVAYEYTVTLRPGIEWSDYTSASAASTYLYSNYTSFSLWNSTTMAPQAFTYQYPWPSVTMNTETIQSADLILSWEILVTSEDYSSAWANIVDVAPVNNLTATYYLSAQSATFVTSTLGNPILPYHTWAPHDWATSNTAAWNFTGAANGYDVWDVGYDPTTGTSNDLIGSGPFMFTNSYGQPQGYWNQQTGAWSLYVNPYYFVQYVPSLQQYTPRIAQITTPLYSTESAAVAALDLGQVDTILNGVDPTFIPTIDTIPGTSIFYQPSGSFGYIEFNSGSNDAPYNITAFRQALNYATDKAYLASVVDEGYDDLGQPTVPIADSVWHNYSAPEYAYDTAEAETLIGSIPGMTQVSGNWYYDGSPVTADMQITVASEDPLGVEGALLVAQEWSSVGVPTTVTQEAFSTLVSNLITVNYNSINLGITGIQGDPTSWFLEAYNQVIGTGTGFYEGPFSSLEWNGTLLNGTQVDDLVDNLTIELNSITSFTQRLNLADEIEGIAADESTIVNLGYPVLILPFSNSTFDGLIKDSLAYSSFMYWNFLSFYEKSFVAPTPPSHIPTQLHVGVVEAQNVYYDGQYGNITVEVRNQYGQPVPGMNLSIGYNPEGALLNITPDSALTNSAGEYTWEFQVLAANPLVYTADYSGAINVSVAASAPSGTSGTFEPALGWTSLDVAPQAVAYQEVASPSTLVSGGAAQPVTLKVYDPTTGDPLSGYQYSLEALSGAVVLTSGIAGQTVASADSYNPIYGFGFAAVQVGPYADYNLTVISGVTGANGEMTVDVAANASVNFTAMGPEFQSWLFVGAYANGGPLIGESPYALIAQVTSNYDSSGFGVDEPVEVPLLVAEAAPAVDLALTVTPSVGATSEGTITVTATEAGTSTPVANYTVTLTSQNAEGANRGVIASAEGQEIEAYTPNEYFGSDFIPGLVVTTDAAGNATATFSPGLYAPSAPGGAFAGFTALPFTDPYLVPFDEFEISAWGATAGTASATIVSTGTATPASEVAVISEYVGGASSLNGVVTLPGNATYPLYVNSTWDSPWGPSATDVAVNVSASLGTVGTASGSTGSSGSYQTTWAAPLVTVLTAATLSATSTTGSSSQTVYLSPVTTVTTTLPGKTVTTTSAANTTELDAAIAAAVILGILAVVFAVLWARKGGKEPPQSSSPPRMDDDMTTSTTSGTSGGTGGAGGGPPSQ